MSCFTGHALAQNTACKKRSMNADGVTAWLFTHVQATAILPSLTSSQPTGTAACAAVATRCQGGFWDCGHQIGDSQSHQGPREGNCSLFYRII